MSKVDKLVEIRNADNCVVTVGASTEHLYLVVDDGLSVASVMLPKAQAIQLANLVKLRALGLVP